MSGWKLNLLCQSNFNCTPTFLIHLCPRRNCSCSTIQQKSRITFKIFLNVLFFWGGLCAKVWLPIKTCNILGRLWNSVHFGHWMLPLAYRIMHCRCRSAFFVIARRMNSCNKMGLLKLIGGTMVVDICRHALTRQSFCLIPWESMFINGQPEISSEPEVEALAPSIE